MPRTKCFPYRPHDYVYDPIFTVSGPTDHYKAAVTAKMSTAKFQICPVFPNMFSDLPNHPRVQMVERSSRIPTEPFRDERMDKNERQKTVDVRGADRLKFFCPVIKIPSKDELPFKGPLFTIERAPLPPVKTSIVHTAQGEISQKNAQVQTMYRESEAQTIPWEPPYKIIGEDTPEILKLQFLQWGSGLPAGMHEVRLVERARMKSSWEKTLNPEKLDERGLKDIKELVGALERDEWAFREQEIREIQELRLQLLEEMLNGIHYKSNKRNTTLMNRIIKRKEAEKKRKLDNIKKQAARDLRKLDMKHKGMQMKCRARNIIEEHTNKASQLYVPTMRDGEHPKRWHMVIDEKMKRYKAQFIGVEEFNTLPRWLDQATVINPHKLSTKIPGNNLCIRLTKWTYPVLQELHQGLKDLRKETKKTPCSLRVKNPEIEWEMGTPETDAIDSREENEYQAMVMYQSIIKGRAVQMKIYEGRNSCMELIKELKSNVGLVKKQKEIKSNEKLTVRKQQRDETAQVIMIQRLKGTLGRLQGTVVGTLLDFLNKELRRLYEERKAHAMCWISEREKVIREAAEAGRRQKELRRRREHDEMFKQIVKVTQDDVDLYLQDIITEGMDFASQEEAREYVQKLAKRIDEESEDVSQMFSFANVDEQDEIVADMIHHFVMPEVEKQLVRQKIQLRQRQKLRTVHDSIYSKIENLPKIDSSSIQSPESTPCITIYEKSDVWDTVRTIVEEIEMKVEEYLDAADAERVLEEQLDSYHLNLEMAEEDDNEETILTDYKEETSTSESDVVRFVQEELEEITARILECGSNEDTNSLKD